MAIPRRVRLNLNQPYVNTTLKLPAQNSNILNENTSAKLLTKHFQKILKECIEILGEQKSMLRTYGARMKSNRSGKVFGVEMLHLIKMLPG